MHDRIKDPERHAKRMAAKQKSCKSALPTPIKSKASGWF